jgi:hypothetical protein
MVGLIILAAVLAAFFLFWYKKVKVPGIVQPSEESTAVSPVNVNVSMPPSTAINRILDQPIQMSTRTFNALVGVLTSITEDHEGRREELKNKLNRIMITEQEECIKRVIQTLSFEYSSAIDDTAQEKLDMSTKVLDLYLQVDLNKILKEEFKRIRDNNSFEVYTPEDITEKISVITENVVRGMKLAIREYIMLVNREIFIKLFDSQIAALKSNISNVIKRYVSSSKETKFQLDEALKQKTEALEEKLRSFIEVV